LGPQWNVQAPPNLSGDDFPTLLDAGINDWGGVSPVTIDHVNPEAPWPQVALLEEATRERGLELAPRLPLYPEYVAELPRWVDPKLAGPTLRQADAAGLAREDDWSPGETAPVPLRILRGSTIAAEPVEEILARDELDEDDLEALFRTRGDDRR